MTTRDLEKIKSLEKINLFNKEVIISDFYSSDLLSWVMGHVRDNGVCLLTILNSVNIIAVACLLDMSCVIFCEGVVPSEDVIQKANEEGIILYKTNMSSSHILKELYAYESIL